MTVVKSGVLLRVGHVDKAGETRDEYIILVGNVHARDQGDDKIGKADPVTGREGPWGCETSGLPHLLELDSRLIDGCKVVRLTRRWPFTLHKNS
jgi:hypothetical protein